MNPVQIPVRSPEVELWFARHVIVNPLKAWKQSAGSRAADVAFRAIAADERLLFTTDGKTALAMAEQAEGIAVSLKEMGPSLSAVLHTVCDIVLLHVDEWKAAEKKFSQNVGRNDLTVKPMPARSVANWSTSSEVKALLKHPDHRCPQFSNAAGNTVASIVLGMGPSGLARLGDGASNKLSVISARFVARSFRHTTFKGALSKKDCLAVLQVVVEWASINDSQLLKVGYEGSFGTFADRARGLAYDAISCMELSAELPGQGAAGYCRWERAVERHSYAAIALDPGIIQRISFDKAKIIAASAIRHVNATAEGSSSEPLLDLPGFLAVRSPSVIQTMLMRLFPEGVPARRSDALNGQDGLKRLVDHDIA